MKSFSTVDDIFPTYTVVCGSSVDVALGVMGLTTGGIIGPRIPITGGRANGGITPTNGHMENAG